MARAPGYVVSLFYLYAPVDDVAAAAGAQRALLDALAMRGRVRVACEGINATVSGQAARVRAYQRATEAAFGAAIDFKDAPAADHCFPDLQVRETAEIVTLGVSPADVSYRDAGVALSPSEFKHRVQTAGEGVVVLDVRNKYESDIGYFVSTNTLRPPIRHFSDLPAWVDKHSHQLQAASQVLMYCTGGVRCERASALVVKRLGLDRSSVCQLRGGITRFLDEFSGGAGVWAGKNLVFDGRIAVQSASNVVGVCLVCDAPHDDYSPNHRCSYCRCRLLVCEQCAPPPLCDDCRQQYAAGQLRKAYKLKGLTLS